MLRPLGERLKLVTEKREVGKEAGGEHKGKERWGARTIWGLLKSESSPANGGSSETSVDS